jgi:serine/threonine protein kinase
MRASCAGCGKALAVEWRDGAAAVRLADATPAPPVRMETPVPAMAPAPAEGPWRTAAAAARRGKPPAAKEEPAEEAPAEAPVVAEFAPGTSLGRYVLSEAIGAGGTGTVYRAFDPTTNRYVALKILAKELKDERRDRFLREIEVQANLRHPHIMPVFDRGEHDGRPYFTMELLYRPFTLTDVVSLAREGTLFKYATLAPLSDLRQVVRTILIPACDGIYVANVENGVIHRDLKPDNVLIDSRTLRAYVIDFGICHVIGRPGRRISTTVVAPTADQTGIVGTPRFLAPEQARGSVHERTDVWGLGAMLRFAVSGEPPIAPASAITRAELRRRIDALREAMEAARAAGDATKADLCAEKLARLEDQGVRPLDALLEDARAANYLPLPDGTPGALAQIVDRAMAAKPLDRYPDARAVATDLETWLRGAKKAEAVGGRGPAERRRATTRKIAQIAAFFAAGAIGFGLGTVLAGGGRGRESSSRVDEAAAEVAGVQRMAAAVAGGGRRPDLPPVEAGRLHDALQARLADVVRRLDGGPEGPSVDAAREDARRVAARFGRQRVTFAMPGDPRVIVLDLGRDEQMDLTSGQASLAPGEYRVVVGDVVRVPVRVPLAFDAKAAPPIEISVPLPTSEIPDGYVLVVGRSVEPRGPPFSAAAPAVEVASFLMDRREVANHQYAEYLDSIRDREERAKHVPATGFVSHPSDPTRFLAAAGAEELPVVGLSVEDAEAYLAWRSRKEGATVRLPTEAEWVLAAGAPVGMLLPGVSASELDRPEAFAPLAPPLRSVSSDAKDDLSPFGLERMLGNAREIVRSAGEDGAFLTKGAAVGDAPVEAGIRAVRPIERQVRHERTGIRAVREIAPRKE